MDFHLKIKWELIKNKAEISKIRKMENTKVVSVIKIIARPIKWIVLFIIKNIQLYFIKKRLKHVKNEKIATL